MFLSYAGMSEKKEQGEQGGEEHDRGRVKEYI